MIPRRQRNKRFVTKFVPAFDPPVTELDIYWFDMPGAGAWQYRIDDRGWENSPTTTAVGDNKLHKLTVAQPVARRLLIPGFDGVRPSSPQSRA